MIISVVYFSRFLSVNINFLLLFITNFIIIYNKLNFRENPTLVHGNKAKPICTAKGPSSKICEVILHRNKAKLKNFKSHFAPQ